MSLPAITALAPWFGGKRNLAPEIVATLGKHRVYWEPFCGSMAVLLAKPASTMETVNDLHGDLINLARVIQDAKLAPQLYRRLRRAWLAEALFEEAAERIRQPIEFDGPNLERACDYMQVVWTGRNGVAGTASNNHGFCVRYTANGGHSAKRWQSVVESIPAWSERMRNVTILSRDAFEVLPRIEDREGTAIYVDPPYLSTTRSKAGNISLRRGKGSSCYVHDFAETDHARLAEALRRFTRARVVVSYYDDPALAELYPGWAVQQIEVSKAMSSQTQGQSHGRAVEVLLSNIPSHTQEMLF